MNGIKVLGFRSFYSFLTAIAQDISDVPSLGPTMVIAPHPDDETLSCGAAIARARSAHQKVRVVIVTDGRESSLSGVITPEELAFRRRGESLAAIAKLGCSPDDVAFLNFKDGRASEWIDEIAGELERQIVDFLPRQIFSPCCRDSHGDHRAVGLAVRKLIEQQAIRCPVYDYFRLRWRDAFEYLLQPRRLLRVRRISTSGILEAKRASFAEHKSQCENITGEASWNVVPAYWVQMFFQPHELFLQSQ